MQGNITELGRASESDRSSAINTAYAWYVVAALHALYICSFMDRELIGVMVGPMKRDLHLTDTQVGLAQGLAFALCYSIVGVPIGRLVDRISRKWLIVVGVSIWSLVTALSAFARNAPTLFLARTAVGIGEATLSPSAYSMIADLFDKDKLGRALSIYGLGSTIGGSLAVILGGAMVQLLDGRPPIAMPLGTHIFAWQATYLVVGVPGLVFAVIFSLTVKEVRRRDLLRHANGTPVAQVSLAETLAFVRTRWVTYALLFGGHALYSLAGYGSSAWMPTFFARIHGWTMGQVATRVGLVALVAGLAGPVVAGWFADRLYRKGDVDASVRLSAYAMFAAAVVAVFIPLVSSATLTIALMVINVVLLSFLLGLPLASIQLVTPNQLRGQVSALFLFVVNIVGIGLGATSIGFLTDRVFGYEGAVRYSLAIVPSTALLLGGIALFACSRPFRRAFELSKQWAP